MRARNHWGWGFEDAAVSTADARAAAPGARRAARLRRAEPEEPVAARAVALPAPRAASRPPHLAGICTADAARARRHACGKSYLDIVRGLRGRFEHAARPRRPPARRARGRGVLEWAGARERGRHPLRRRHVRRRRRRAAVADALRRRGHARPRRRSTACSRSTRSRARRASGAGALGPRLEEQLAPARPDAAPLPAVVRVLDARRLDRDALRRPLRDALHAHRRLRRVDPRGHARRALGVAAAAGLGRGPVARPACCSARRGSSASSPRRGCACRPRPRPPRRARRALRRRSAGGAEAVRALAQSGLYPANCRLLDAREARADRRRRRARRAARARLRVGRPPARRRGSTARSRSAASTAATRDERRRRRGGGRRGRRVAQGVPRAPYLRDALVRARRDQRDVRDRVHVGALPGAPRGR